MLMLLLLSLLSHALSQAKVRGRRAEKKNKKEHKNDDHEEREENRNGSGIEGTSQASEKSVEGDALSGQLASPFFGLVDSNELDYFKQAELTLNIDAFDSDEDRLGFIRSVLEEARGKELKLVTNQICSKLMERLVLYALDGQLKRIFRLLQTHFCPLAHHKYASHVLETLFVRAAALIEKELAGMGHESEHGGNEGDEGEEDLVPESMELLFLSMIQELKPQLPQMVKHQYASHLLRLIILILAGKELPSTTRSNSTLRSKKSKIARKMIEIKDTDDFNRAFLVPPTFKNELKQICETLAANIDRQKARALAIDKVASPLVQLVILVEGLVDRERTWWHLIFQRENDPQQSQEEAFVEHLLSDSVGLHFLQALILNDGARIKYLERLFELYMKSRILKLCKRANTGVYVIQALLTKLKPRHVEYMLDEIVPHVSLLVSTADMQNLDLAQHVIDASISRGNYLGTELIGQLFVKFAPNYLPENPGTSSSTEFLENTLHLASLTLGNTRDDWPTAEERRRALFVEKLMAYDFKFVVCMWLNLMALPSERFEQMCMHGVFSHVVELALVVIPASEGEPKPIQILRKRFLNLFASSDLLVSLACNLYGSHIMDHLWQFTVLLPMYKDRIGMALQAESTKVKDSRYGKMVWKNWNMDLFMRKKFDWKALIKNQHDEYFGNGIVENGGLSARPKRPIELKLEQLAKEKQERQDGVERAELGYTKRKLDREVADIEKRRVRGRR